MSAQMPTCINAIYRKASRQRKCDWWDLIQLRASMIFTSGQRSSLETSFSPLVLILEFSCLDRCSTRCLQIASKDEADLQRDSNSPPTTTTPHPRGLWSFLCIFPTTPSKTETGLEDIRRGLWSFPSHLWAQPNRWKLLEFWYNKYAVKLELVLERYHVFWSFATHMCLLTCIRGQSVSNRWSISLQDPCG